MAEKKPGWIEQTVRQTVPWRTQTQTAAIIALILVVAIIIGALYLAQATTTATTGRELAQLGATRDFLQQQNEDTSANIALHTSITTLRGRAQTLGFIPVDPDHVEYLVVSGYAPDRATATPVITPAPTFVYDETFNGWVQKQWDILVRQFEAWSGNSTPTPEPIQ